MKGAPEIGYREYEIENEEETMEYLRKLYVLIRIYDMLLDASELMPGYKIEARGLDHKRLAFDIREAIIQGCNDGVLVGEDLSSYNLEKQEQWGKTRVSEITKTIWGLLKRYQGLNDNQEIPAPWRAYIEKMAKLLDKLYVKKMQEQINAAEMRRQSETRVAEKPCEISEVQAQTSEEPGRARGNPGRALADKEARKDSVKETQSQRIFEDYDFEDSFDENPLPNMGRVQGEESEHMEDEYVDLPDDMSIAEFLAIPEGQLVAKFKAKRETLLRNQWKRAEIKRRKALTPAEHAAE